MAGLATSLHNLSEQLAVLGRNEEALALTEEAVEIRRRLASDDPEAFLPQLARSLARLRDRLTAFGRSQEARAIEAEMRGFSQ